MKSIRTLATVVVVFGMSSYAQAGLFDHLFGHKGGGCDGCDASKCCDCAPTCEPECCKPVIVRPCHKNVYTYQRQISCLKPPMCDPDTAWCDGYCSPSCDSGNGACCDDQCGPGACCPAPCHCGGNCNCGPESACTDNNACCQDNVCCPGDGCNNCCPTGCCDMGCDCCPEMCEQACEVAHLIYESQTACDPGDREEAIDDLGDYSVCCYPEIMAAFLYALNDADPEVREQAADEIGDALEDNPCLCNQCVIDALTCALADCDDGVVDQAEEAIEECGYEIVDCCELECVDVCCDPCAPGCAPGCAPYSPSAQPMQMDNGEGEAPAPVPPEDTKAYFPRQLPKQTSKKFSLRGLFSLID